MNNNTPLTWMAIQTVVLIVPWVISFFFKPYFQEKGKNLAIIEDIDKITKIIENIKQDLSAQNDILKNKLSLQTEHKINIRAAERDALFDYFKSTMKLKLTLRLFSFSTYDENNYNDLELINQIFEGFFLEMASNHAIVSLYNSSDPIANINLDLTYLFDEMRSLIIQAKKDIVAEYNLYKTNYPVTISKNIQPYKEMEENVSNLVRKYNTLKSDRDRKMFAFTNSLIEEIRKRLKELENIA